MRKVRLIIVMCCLAAFGAATSHADSLTAYFNLSCPSGYCSANTAGVNPVGPITTVPAVGQITFTLLGNGTISATLDDYGPAIVSGFGFDQCFCNIAESGFTPGAPDYVFGWEDAFGYQLSGFASYVTFGVPLEESWIIGNPGDYTSVDQLLNGGNSVVNFVLIDNNGNWGADVESITPEPSSLLLLGTGALGLLGVIRRKLAR